MMTLEEALKIARHQKEVGICSLNGQAIVLLYEEIERLKEAPEVDYALAYNKLFEEFTNLQLEVDARMGLPFVFKTQAG